VVKAALVENRVAKGQTPSSALTAGVGANETGTARIETVMIPAQSHVPMILEEAQMATKTDFTADEWKLLLQSPLVVAVAISSADPSGLIGLIKESMASARALLAAVSDPDADALVKAVATDYETSEGRVAAQDGFRAAIAGAKLPAELVAKATEALKATAAVLDAKGGADAVPFKTWLAGVAKAVAEAAPEGGFLGFGGTQVSDAERATVAEVAAALGVPAPAV